jgi:hypothetical protein
LTLNTQKKYGEIRKDIGTYWVLFGYYRGEIVPEIKEK